MVLADIIAIAVIALFALIGLLVGFGRGLRFFTKGIFGFIISVFVCYWLGGVIYQLEFVQSLLGKFTEALTGKGGFCDFLLTIRIEVIVYYVVLFIIVSILRAIIVKIVSSVFEIENVFLKLINRIFGMVLFVAAIILISMIVFNIIYMIGGSVSESVLEACSGSVFNLDELYLNNPLMEIIQMLFRIEIRIPVTVQ